METIPIDWYYQSPIDFEHKQYVLLAYLQTVDKSFSDKKVSPYLLHMEYMESELTNFKYNFGKFKKESERNRYHYFKESKVFLEKEDIIEEVNEIVEFALPQIKPRIQLGYKICIRYKQLLY
jgi:hypothetical protein